jgi:restriction endonuclease S subunit
MMKKFYTGVAIKNISKSNIESIKIPVPTFERQKEIVKYLDFIYEKANKTSNEKIMELKKLNNFCLNNQKIFGNNELKKLSEICKFLPKSKRNAKYGNKEGEYPFFKSSIGVNSYVNEPDYFEESLIIGDGGEPNINYGTKFSTSDHCYVLQNKNKKLLNIKYVYYYLFYNLEIMKNLYTGMAIKNISKSNIEGIKIPFPSFERQKEIIKYCENNDKLIKKLEKEIENNKKQAQEFITNIIKSNLKEE